MTLLPDSTEEKFSCFARKHPLFFIFFLLLLVLAFLFRIAPLGRTPEYDEVYTMTHFVPLSVWKIFTEVATPNNHMLHTLFVKLVRAPGSDFHYLSLRLPSAIAGTLSILLLLLFRKNFQSLYGVLFSMLFFAFNGAHIHFSRTARGYSLVTFFLLLALFALWEYDRKRRENAPEKTLWLLAGLYFFAGLSSSVSVSAGVLFAFSLSLAFLLFFLPWRAWKSEGKTLLKKYLPLGTAGVLLALLLGSYYISLAPKFARGGSDFGTESNTLSLVGKFLWETFSENDFLYPLLLALAGLLLPGKERKRILFLLFACFPVLAGTLLTKTGPPRVYLPLAAFLLPAAAMGAEKILLFVQEKYALFAERAGRNVPDKAEKSAGILFFLLFLLLFAPVYFTGSSTQENLMTYDMNLLCNALEDDPRLKEVLAVFSPTDSVALRAIRGNETEKKLILKVPDANALLLTEGAESMGTMDKKREKSSHIPLPRMKGAVPKLFIGGKFLPCIPMRKVEKPYRENEVIFLFVFLVEPSFASLVKEMQNLKGFRHLNYLQTIVEDARYAGLLVSRAEEVTLTPEEMAALEEKTGSRIRFRLLQE